MKRTLGLLLVSAGLLAPALELAPGLRAGAQIKTGVQSEAGLPSVGEEDPDIPEFARGKIDKETYLRLRAEHVAMLRGLDPGRPLDPRVRGRAILEMQRQEALLGLGGPQPSGGEGLRSFAAASLASPFAPPAWAWVGPAPIPNGQTENIVTPVSGRTTAIAVHPTNPNVVYVGTAQGGLYRTLNGGASWTPIFDSAQSLAIGAVAIAPSDPSIVYVGTGEPQLSADSFFGVGLYRINNAETTADLTGPIDPPVATGISGTTAFTGRSISKIVVHPTDAATVFVSTTRGASGNPSNESLSTTVPPLALRGVYRSTNATSDSPSFTRLTVTTAGSVAPDAGGDRDVIDLAIEPGNPNTLLATVLGTNAEGDGGVWRTTNALAPSPVFARTLALGGPPPTVNSSAGRAELAVNKVAGVTTVYVASGESSGLPACGTGGTLRKSVDGGVTWTPPLPGGNGFCAAQCFYNIALAVDPLNPNNVLLGGNVTGIPPLTCSRLIAKSMDGGVTFENTAAGVHADNHVVVFAPSDPTVVYMGTDGGIYKSTTSGLSWTSLSNTTFSATQFQSIALHPKDRNFLIGGTQDNGSPKMNPDATWTRSDAGDGGYALIDQNSTDTTTTRMYHTYFNQTGSQIGWAVSTNAGGSWSFRNCGTNGISCADAVLFYAPMALGPGNPNTLYFGTDKLYRSTNGTTMTAVSQTLVAGQPLTTIAVSPADDKARLAGTRNGKVFATTTGAATLADVSSPDFPQPNPGSTRRAVARAVIDPGSQAGGPFTAYVAFTGYNVAAGRHVWKTTNLDTREGAPPVTWTPAGHGIPDVPVNALVIDPENSEVLYAGTDIGVYKTRDGGQNWFPFSAGLPRVAVFDLAIQNQHRVLRAATHGRGVWEIPVPLPVCTNQALAANGASAAASSVYPNGDFSTSSAIDGDRTGLRWGAGGGWADATRAVYPDWLEVSLYESKRVSGVRVYTLANDFAGGQEPTETTAASIYGLIDFDVQVWDGSRWVTVPGGAIRGNALALRAVTFPEVTTSKVRLLALNAREHFSRVVELEVLGCDLP